VFVYSYLTYVSTCVDDMQKVEYITQTIHCMLNLLNL